VAGRIYVGRDPQTRKKKYDNHTIHGTRKDAQAYVNAKLTEQDRGMYASVDRIVINELLEALLLDYKINGKSYTWAELVMRVHLRPFFGRLKAAALTTDFVQRYIAKRKEPEMRTETRKGRTYEKLYPPAANGTINRELSMLRHAYNLGRKSTPPKVGLVPLIPTLAENNVRKGFFEHTMFLAIINALPSYLRPVVWFACCTGCRKGEILTIRWSQVDLDERVVRLEPGETKNDDGRLIPIVPDLYQVLTLEKEIRDLQFPKSPWVFSRQGDQIIDFRKAWAAACVAAGLVDDEGAPDKLFHDLRRTGVRNLIRSGVSEKVAMRISGHKTRAMLDRYDIVDERDLRDAARKYGEYLARKNALESTAPEKQTPISEIQTHYRHTKAPDQVN
jgi:integrase